MLQCISDYALSKKRTQTTFLHEDKTLVVNIMGKMYLHIDNEAPSTINLKCDLSCILCHLGWNQQNLIRHSINCF